MGKHLNSSMTHGGAISFTKLQKSKISSHISEQLMTKYAWGFEKCLAQPKLVFHSEQFCVLALQYNSSAFDHEICSHCKSVDSMKVNDKYTDQRIFFCFFPYREIYYWTCDADL